MPPKRRRLVRRKIKEDTGENPDSCDAEDSQPSPNLVESNVEKEEKDVVSSARRSSRNKQNTPSDDLLQIESSPSLSSTIFRRSSRRSQKPLNESVGISPEKTETVESMEIDNKNENTIDVECANEKTRNLVEKESLEKTESMDIDDKTQVVDSSSTSLKVESIESSEMKITKKNLKCRVKLVSLGDTLQKTELEEPSSSDVDKMDIEESKLELVKEPLDLKDEKDSLNIDISSGKEFKNSVIDNSLKNEIVNTETDKICEIRNKDENLNENASTEATCKISCNSIPILPNANQEEAAEMKEVKEDISTVLSGKHLSEKTLVSEIKENFETVNKNILLITSDNKSQNKSSNSIKSCEESNTSISDSPVISSAEVCDKIESALCSSSPSKNSTLPLNENSIKMDELLKNKNSDSSNILLTDLTKNEEPQKDTSNNPTTKFLESDSVKVLDLQIATPEKENEKKMDTADKIIEEKPTRIPSNLENDATVKMETSSEPVRVSRTVSTPKVKCESDLIDDKDNKLDSLSKCSEISQNEDTSIEAKTIKKGEEENENHEISKNIIAEIKPDRETTVEIKSLKSQTEVEMNEKSAATSKIETDEIAESATVPETEANEVAKQASTSKTEEGEIAKLAVTSETGANEMVKPVSTSETEADQMAKPAATSKIEVNKNEENAEISETEADQVTKPATLITKLDDVKLVATSITKVDKAEPAAVSILKVDNAESAVTSKTEADQIEKLVATSVIERGENAEPAGITNAEIDKNAATSKTEADQIVKSAAPKMEVDKNADLAENSRTEGDKNSKPAATSNTDVDKNTEPAASSKTEVDENAKPVATSITDATPETGVNIEKSVSISKTEIDIEISVATSKTEVDKNIELSTSEVEVNKNEKLTSKTETDNEKSVLSSKPQINQNEKSASAFKAEVDISEKPFAAPKVEKSESEKLVSVPETESNKNEKSSVASKIEMDASSLPATGTSTKSDKIEIPAVASKTDESKKSEQPSKTEADKKETSVHPPKTETGSDSQKNRIPGRGFIIGTRGVAEHNKKTLFDCVLCFNGEEKYGVPGGILNKHIKTKEHALKVMEVENLSLYKKFKDDPSAKSEDIINAILEYEETQTRQTLVLATGENYLSQRLFLVKKIELLKECDAKPDSIKVTSEGSDLKEKLSKPNTEIVSSGTSMKVPSRKRTLSTEQVEPVPAKIPLALNTLSFISTLKKNDTVNEKELEADSTTAAGKYSPETLSQQLAEKQRSRNPDKIVLVMDDRDVFLCAEKLGDFVRVIRKRELDFARAVDLVKSDFWFGKGTLFLFLGGVFSSIKVRKHSACAQYKCEIPVRVYHVEKDIPTNIIIDEALQLHKVILDSTTNDQAFFCDLLPVNLDSYNLLKLDKRLCYSTHPIDFHKKVPIQFMNQYTDAVNEFNKFVEKHTEKLGFKFESLIEGTFGKIVSDVKLVFGDLTTDGVALNEMDYERRCSSILNKVEAIRKQLHSTLSVNDPTIAKTNEENIQKSNEQFDKVAIIANSYYKETLTHFASGKVVVYADEDLKFDGIEQFILEKKENLPEKTLWLTLIGSFCISEIIFHDACQTKLSCKEPLITLVPSSAAQGLASLPETIRKIKDSTLALLKKVRSLIGPKSMFFIIPPYPPTIVSELSFTHSDLHSLKCPDTQIYVASEEVISQLNSAFTKLSQEIISLLMKEFQSHKLKCSSVESYSKSLPASGHIQIVRRKSDPRSGLFNKWKDCVKGMISEFVDCSSNEISVPVRNTKKFNHLIFIGHQSLLNQISNRSGAKFSTINVSYPINFEFLQMKLSSLKSVSNKPMLFVITCDFSLIAKEVFDAKCNNLKCPKMMSYLASDSKDVKTIISDKLMNMRSMILKIKETYVNATVIIAPLFSRHCVERPIDINETVHRTLHVILKHSCSPCVVEGPRKFWEEGISLLQYYLRDEVLSNLYLSNDQEPLTNAIESFLSVETPYIQWIKPVVAPITDKFKYNMKVLFDKLSEVSYYKGLNDTAKTKNSITDAAKGSSTKAVTPIELKKTSGNKKSIPVVKSIGISTIIGKPVPNYKNKNLVTSTNKKSSGAAANTSKQPSYPETSQNTSTGYQATQNTSTNYQVPTTPFTYNAMGGSYDTYGMNQGFYPSNSYSYYFPNQPTPTSQHLPSMGMHQQPPPISQIPLPAFPYQFPPPQQDISQQQYYSGTADVNHSYNNNFNNSTTPSYTQSQITQPSISDVLLSSSVEQVISAPAVKPVSAPKEVKSVSKKVPLLTTPPTVVRSVVKSIVIEKPKELVDFLFEFASNTWKDRPYEHAFVIGKKELIEPLASQNMKNVKFIYQNLASINEGQVSFLIKKLGSIPHRSVCFLAFGLSIIMKTTPMTPGCIKFKCKQPVPGSCLKSQSHLSKQMSIITRIKEIVNLSEKMATYIPVVVLPIFPSKIFVDDARTLPYHKISHAINDKNSYVLIGERSEWKDFIATFLQTWNNFMKVHHDKYTYPKAIPKYPYMKDMITIRDKLKEFFEEDNQPVFWENTVKKIIKILMSYTESSNIEKTITVTKTEETTINNKVLSSADTSTQIVVKVWNFSDSIPEGFFDFLFKAIDPNADLDKIVENDEYYYLVKLNKVSAILITRKLNNTLIGDSTLCVSLIQNQDDYPELTSAQEKYITSMFQDAYSRFKPQIIKNIKNKLLNVIDFTNYKTSKCKGACGGDKANCNLYHSSNDRRRNPLLYTYGQKMCSSPESCAAGDLCSSSHNIYEVMFCPTNFQTILCPLHDVKTPITNGFCKFAHKNSPELFFTGSWQDIVTFGSQNSLRFLLGAIRAIHKLSLRTDVKICFITQSEEFLETVFKIIDDIAFQQYTLKCVNLEKIRYSTNSYDVYFGKPSTVNNYSGKILSINDYGVLIVDNIKDIMKDSQDAEHLLRICQRLKISAGLRSPINKVFVSSSYDQGVTGIVSRFLGIPLQEVKDSDIHPEPKFLTEVNSKSNLEESGKDIVVISSKSRSRSHSRSRTSRSHRSGSRSRRRRSRSLKRRSRSRSRSKPRRKRSVSRSRRSPSRSRKRRSRSHSVTKSRRRRSPSRSRRSRSKSKTRPSKAYRKRSNSPKSVKTKKRQASPTSPPQISKILKLDELLAKQSQISSISKLDDLSRKLSQNVFSPREIFQSSSQMSLEQEKNVPSVKTLGDEIMYRKFMAKKASIQSSIEEEFKAYKAFPELHPNYETHYEEFLKDYYKTYGRNTKEDHKEGLWIMFWAQKVKRLKETEFDNKIKELEKEFLKPQPKNVEKTKPSAPQNTTSAASPDTFSIEGTLKLLEELTPEFGMLGPAIVAIINSARESGPTTSKGLSVIIDEENLVLVKMIIEKMNSLQKTCSSSQLPKLIKGVEWTQKLIEYAKNPPKEQGLNLMAIAKASLGKDSGFTLNLIKTALAYEGMPSMGKEETNKLFLKVCSIHFEMAMQDK